MPIKMRGLWIFIGSLVVEEGGLGGVFVCLMEGKLVDELEAMEMIKQKHNFMAI